MQVVRPIGTLAQLTLTSAGARRGPPGAGHPVLAGVSIRNDAAESASCPSPSEIHRARQGQTAADPSARAVAAAAGTGGGGKDETFRSDREELPFHIPSGSDIAAIR